MKEKLKSRAEEITSEFLKILDRHLADLVEGKTSEMKEINEIAELMFIHPTHLSDSIKSATGKSACYFYEHKIIDIAKSLLELTDKTVTEIAYGLTYDPSNFTKFFKSYVNKTPRQYRKAFLKNAAFANTVLFTKI